MEQLDNKRLTSLSYLSFKGFGLSFEACIDVLIFRLAVVACMTCGDSNLGAVEAVGELVEQLVDLGRMVLKIMCLVAIKG